MSKDDMWDEVPPKNTLDEILDDYYQDRTLDIIKRKSFIAKVGEVVEPADWHTKAKASLIDYIESLIPEKNPHKRTSDAHYYDIDRPVPECCARVEGYNQAIDDFRTKLNIKEGK
jgi:hypothetical protein